jgi:hypothetical protein
MSAMGLSEYCLDINDLKADRLIEKFCQLEANSDIVKPLIRAKARDFREALDEQYKFIFHDLLELTVNKPERDQLSKNVFR